MASSPMPFLKDFKAKLRFERGCLGKDRYPSESAAGAALTELLRSKRVPKAHLMHAYKCEFCLEWHIGHADGGGE